MLPYYSDIRSRIKEEPLWVDDNGVPRYDKFNPDLVSSIYAEEAILLSIECQDCGQKFLVGMCWSQMNRIFNPHSASFTERIKEYLKERDKKDLWFPVHYGDPPSHGCVGDTMNCIDIAIMEFWLKEKFEWKRYSNFEIKT